MLFEKGPSYSYTSITHFSLKSDQTGCLYKAWKNIV